MSMRRREEEAARKKALMTTVLNSKQDWQRILSLFGSAIVAYYPQRETTGIIANDVSGNANNGTYENVTLNDATFNGKPAPLFNSSFMNVYTAKIAAVDFSESSVITWMTSTDWTTDVEGYPWTFYRDSNNFAVVNKAVTGSTPYIKCAYKGNGTIINDVCYHGIVTSEFVMVGNAISATGGYSRIYINGQRRTNTAGAVAWAGSGLSNTKTGFGSNTSAYFAPIVNSHMSNTLILNRAFTDAEAETLYKIFTRPITVSILGDSISAYGTARWYDYLDGELNSRRTLIKNHAASGHSIVANMAAQATAAASDGAEKIYIALGVNDNNAGDMGALQTAYTNAVTALKASNPTAEIIALNVLKVWTDETQTVEADKSNIRTAISASCTATGVQCVDTYEWSITRSDGIHPTSPVGSSEMAAYVLAL